MIFKEPFLDHLCRTVGTEPSYMLNAVHALRMSSQLRNAGIYYLFIYFDLNSVIKIFFNHV